MCQYIIRQSVHRVANEIVLFIFPNEHSYWRFSVAQNEALFCTLCGAIMVATGKYKMSIRGMG